jgi:phenylacetate-CoA ligase
MVHISYGYGLFTGGLGAHYGAEPWTDAMRSEIEARAGIDAVDIYGLSEVMGPGVASECIESKDGPVIWEDHFYPEIIDPETGEVLPDGSDGELVFTSLSKEALPIIRYRTRDLTRLLPPTSRSMRRIGKITGRSDDMLIIRGVNVFPTQIEELICKMPKLAPQYQLVVSRDGHLDKLDVIGELRPELTGKLTANEVEALARELEHAIKTYVGVSTRVSLLASNSIERTMTGKAKRVIDKRPKTV